MLWISQFPNGLETILAYEVLKVWSLLTRMPGAPQLAPKLAEKLQPLAKFKLQQKDIGRDF
ncbi:MAG: hypothetical protein KIT27_10610 [Legionellales bacterium]|nr:hypothetical protein [Legionellales bacterium]